MKVIVGYDEIAAYIEKQYGAKIVLSNVDETTVKVDYNVNKLPPTVSIDVQFLSVSNEKILMVYDASMALKKIIEGLFFMMRDKIPTDFVLIDTEKCHVTVFPTRCRKYRDMLKDVTLREVKCSENDVALEMKMK